MTTSSLSVDETLLLQTIGWEAHDLVCGASAYSIPKGFWGLGKGENGPATLAYERALHHAVAELAAECRDRGGTGVAGVGLDIEVTQHYVEVTAVGTSIAPQGKRAKTPQFVVHLPVADFVTLNRSGWDAVGLVFGASFTYVPRRGLGTTVGQVASNVELAEATRTLYGARSNAMERMQDRAVGCAARGVVGVQLTQGRLAFARHTVVFAAIGTAIRPRPGRRPNLRPSAVLSMDDTDPALPQTVGRR